MLREVSHIPYLKSQKSNPRCSKYCTCPKGAVPIMNMKTSTTTN